MLYVSTFYVIKYLQIYIVNKLQISTINIFIYLTLTPIVKTSMDRNVYINNNYY